MINSPFEDIEAAALQLPSTERARLAERLLVSLDEDDEILTAWVEEAERRADAYERGGMEAIDFDEAIAQARTRISNRRAARKLFFLKSAQAELNTAVDYYTEHAGERVAEAFLQDALHARRRLIEHPDIGKTISKRLRAFAFKHFPYFLIYRISAETISIHATGPDIGPAALMNPYT